MIGFIIFILAIIWVFFFLKREKQIKEYNNQPIVKLSKAKVSASELRQSANKNYKEKNINTIIQIFEDIKDRNNNGHHNLFYLEHYYESYVIINNINGFYDTLIDLGYKVTFPDKNSNDIKLKHFLIISWK